VGGRLIKKKGKTTVATSGTKKTGPSRIPMSVINYGVVSNGVMTVSSYHADTSVTGTCLKKLPLVIIACAAV